MKSRLPSLDAFVQERNGALFSLDEQKIRAYCKKYDVVIPENPISFWGAIYKAILAISDAPKQTQEKAKLWLKQHNMTEKIADANTGGYPFWQNRAKMPLKTILRHRYKLYLQSEQN